jgi:adenylosuccinate lyase
LIERYATPEMAGLWSPERKYQKWLDVEIAACEAWARLGKIPQRDLEKIRKKARFDVQRIHEIEHVVKHDVIAFLTSVAESLGPESRFVHMGLTSSDVLDTSLALLLKDASDIIIRRLRGLMTVIKRRAFRHRDTVMMGRSHGIHAEPTTMGLKFAMWYDEMNRNLARMKRAREVISYGKLSGAVGTFSSVDPRVERHALRRLGLRAEAAATQVVQRDRHAEFFGALAVLAASMEKIAVEIRHLQRTEVLEAEEPFTKGQKGSSAMPHKRNPILSENLTGLARLVRGYAGTSLENIALWHERDISHSSVERIIAPDATSLVDFMLVRTTALLKGLVVYPRNMKRNMERSKGLIFSQRVLLALIEKGLTREQAYAIVQRNAMAVWEAAPEGPDFRSVLLEDADIRAALTPEELEACFDITPYIKNVPYIFKRVFGGKGR